MSIFELMGAISIELQQKNYVKPFANIFQRKMTEERYDHPTLFGYMNITDQGITRWSGMQFPNILYRAYKNL
jgi:hypothetical protein